VTTHAIVDFYHPKKALFIQPVLPLLSLYLPPSLLSEGYTPLDHARAKPHNAGCLECVRLLQEHIREQPPPIKGVCTLLLLFSFYASTHPSLLPPSLPQIGPLLASFFEAPLDKAWMDWALDHYGPPLLDSKVSYNPPSLRTRPLLAPTPDRDSQRRHPEVLPPPSLPPSLPSFLPPSLPRDEIIARPSTWP